MIDAGLLKEWKNLYNEQTNCARPSLGGGVRPCESTMPERVIDARLVLANDARSEQVKARLCSKCFADPDLQQLIRSGETASPTVSRHGRWLVLQILASQGWRMQLGDITGASLEADEMNRPGGDL